jgi:ACS family D-galactonate transporter-like MFS transporter
MTVATHQKPSRKRFIILTLISLATLINYLDRSVMGVAKPALVAELHITPAVMGLIFSAFSWTYAIAQIPGGYVIDRLGTRLTYALSLGLWSAMTAVHGLMTGVVGLVSSRLALGLAEAPCFPANSRVLSTWFPQQERARATGVYTVGEYIGLGLLIPVLGWMLATWGWRSLFFTVGALGIVFALVFYRLYREPGESGANKAEIDLIAAGGGFSKSTQSLDFTWRRVFRLITTRQIAGASIGQFCSNSTLVFFLTWFPPTSPRSGDDLHQIRLAGLAALYRRVAGRAAGRVVVGLADPLYRLAHHRAQGTDHHRPAAVLLDGAGQCAAQQQCRHRGHVDRLLRPGSGGAGLDAAVRCRPA